MLDRKTLMVVGAMVFILGSNSPAAQPVDSSLTFQGQLKQAGKSVNDACDVHIGLWDAATNGILVATNSFANVDVVDGLFTLALDFGSAAFSGDARWLEISVACPAGVASFETLSPRQPLTAAPYALHALNASGGAGDGHSLDAADGSPVNVVFVDNDGEVGIGTTSPTSKLQVHDGQLRFTGPAGTFMLNSSNAASGPPVGDGFRFIFDANYFGSNLDAVVFEKTDGNGLEPDGGFAFVNTGTDNVQDPALSIRGNGRVGVGTNDPDQDFTVNGQANITGNVGIGITTPSAQLEVVNGGAEDVARFRNSDFTFSGVATALSRTVFESSAAFQFDPAVTSSLTIEAESTTGSGPNEVRILADRPLEVSAPGTLSLVASSIKGGSSGNQINLGSGSTIGGGGDAVSGFDPPGTHLITDHNCTIGGGAVNQAGNNNGDASDARNATVGGGVANIASGRGSTVGGGRFNTASGLFSTVPGGFNTDATGTCSFAAGCQARANHSGSFVWADAFPTNTGPTFASTANNQFNIRANGGVRIASATHVTTGAILAGVQLAPGGSGWGVLSDRNAKENFEAVDGEALLEKLAAIPMQMWNYKSQDDAIRHIGPMAQDFHEAFGVGEDRRHINTIDADGVSLAAIQALHRIVEGQNRRIEALTARIEQLESFKGDKAVLANRGDQ